MKITAFRNYNLTVLALSIGLLFFGFNAAEQYLATFYNQIGLINLAYNSLAILYAAIVLGNIIATFVVNKIGVKSSLLLGFTAYFLLIFGLMSKQAGLIYFLSALLGIGSGILGVAISEFLRLTAPQDKRGEFAGAVNSSRTLGGFLGIVTVSFLIQLISIENTFLLLGIIMALGTACLVSLRLKSHPQLVEKVSISLESILADSKIWLLLIYGLSGGFLLGILFTAISLTIASTHGSFWVGLITSIFHLTVGVSSIIAGAISDIKGRFLFLYLSPIFGVASVLLFLLTNNLWILGLSMLLLGLHGSVASGANTALILDLYEEKIKEVTAFLGIASILLGIVPSFILSKYLTQPQMFTVAIGLLIVSIISLAALQNLLKSRSTL